MSFRTLPRSATYRARLPIRRNGVFTHYSSLCYYFDEEMKELGYTVNSGKFMPANRDWDPSVLSNYDIQKISTNEMVQEGRR